MLCYWGRGGRSRVPGPLPECPSPPAAPPRGRGRVGARSPLGAPTTPRWPHAWPFSPGISGQAGFSLPTATVLDLVLLQPAARPTRPCGTELLIGGSGAWGRWAGLGTGTWCAGGETSPGEPSASWTPRPSQGIGGCRKHQADAQGPEPLRPRCLSRSGTVGSDRRWEVTPPRRIPSVEDAAPPRSSGNQRSPGRHRGAVGGDAASARVDVHAGRPRLARPLASLNSAKRTRLR